MELASIDHVLTTARSVRKRLDLTRPVEPDRIQQCIDIALQAPNGRNRGRYHFIVVTDPTKRASLAELYRKAATPYFASTRETVDGPVFNSATYLAEQLGIRSFSCIVFL
jgi:nitroreductase